MNYKLEDGTRIDINEKKWQEVGWLCGGYFVYSVEEDIYLAFIEIYDVEDENDIRTLNEILEYYVKDRINEAVRKYGVAFYDYYEIEDMIKECEDEELKKKSKETWEEFKKEKLKR